MARLEFEGHAKGAVEKVAVDIKDLVIAGWTGRDVTALNHHIEELKAIGVQPPSRVPIYYRAAAQMLTQADRIQVLGDRQFGRGRAGAGRRRRPSLGDGRRRPYRPQGRELRHRRVQADVRQADRPYRWRFEEVEPHWDG